MFLYIIYIHYTLHIWDTFQIPLILSPSVEFLLFVPKQLKTSRLAELKTCS